MKTVLLGAALAVAALLGFVAFVVGTDSRQHAQNRKLSDAMPVPGAGSRTLVVFFSRSGNTELMARQIARRTQADLIALQSERNRIGFTGWLQALRDARNTYAVIRPGKTDLSGYDTVYIGSPVWLYSPAPQIYEFARQNDFGGKKVILFNSMNSKFEQRYIDDFKRIIEQNGGSFAKHLYIVRSRMGQQMDIAEFLQRTEQLLQE